MQINEAELIALSKTHDADAYGQLVECYKSALYRHCFVLVKDQHAADDLAQESFIAAYYKLNSFDDSRAKFSTWLFKIATNKSLNYLRANKKTSSIDYEKMAQIVSGVSAPDKQAEDQELHRAISGLKPEYAAVVNMYYFEGASYEAIAVQLGKPVGTIKGWMNRAKKQLRKEMS